MQGQPRAVFALALSESSASLPYLSLGMVVAYLRACAGQSLSGRFDVRQVQTAGFPGQPLGPVYEEISRHERPIVLLSSYVWNHDLNMRAAHRLKTLNPSSFIIIGGPEIPKWQGEAERFMQENPQVDVAVLGEGEIACAEVLENLGKETNPGMLQSVTGILYRHGNAISRTAQRDRIRDLEILPSPYLEGEFDDWIGELPTATLETNRGCPYGCTYCDWGSATLQQVARFEQKRVEEEIRYLAANQMESVFIADANFGMLEQDIAIAQALVDARREFGFPRRLYTNFAKNGGRRLMAVIDTLHKGGLLPTGIVALQTTDPDTLKTIERDNIRTASYEKMMTFFNREGIPMASDLMIGLPGQTIASFAEDLQFCFDWKVSAHGNYTSMMPNAPMAESNYRREHQIETDDNNMIASTATFSAADMDYMRLLYLCYLLMVRMSLLRYFLYFIQIDHGVQAINFLRCWLDRCRLDSARYPLSARVYGEFLQPAARGGHWAHLTWDDSAEFLFGDLEPFFDEVEQVLAEDCGVTLSRSERQAIFTTQAAVMPNRGVRYPHSVSLEHDVTAYFTQLKCFPSLRAGDFHITPLQDWAPGTLVSSNKDATIESLALTEMLGHSDSGWELESPLRFY